MHDRGMSYRQFTKLLNEKNILTPKGKKWGVSRNSIYSVEKKYQQRLKDFANQKKIYSHKYEVLDMLWFDNFTTMHSAKSNIDFVNESKSNVRLVWRISCKGKPRLFKLNS